MNPNQELHIFMTRAKRALLDEEVFLESAKSVAGSWPKNMSRDIFQRAYVSLGGFDSDAYRKSISEYATLRTRFRDSLQNLISEYGTGKLSSREALENFRKAAQASYEEAFRLGAMRGGSPYYKELGLTPADQKFVQNAKSSEARYFSRFLNDIADEKGVNPAIRADRYARALDAQYWNGYAAVLSDQGLIHWELGIPKGDHCPDCLEIHAASPFTRHTLPTVPRAGDTRCLANCYCTLSIVEAGREPWTSGAAQSGSPEEPRTGLSGVSVIVSRDTAEGGPVSASVVRLFSDLYDNLYTVRAQIELAPTAAMVSGLIAKRKLINEQLIKLSHSLGVRVVPRYAVADVVRMAKEFQAQGLEVVKKIWRCPR